MKVRNNGTRQISRIFLVTVGVSFGNIQQIVSFNPNPSTGDLDSFKF